MGDRNSKVPGFEFRKGIDSFPDFRGMNRQDDPGAIPQDQFYLLQNARVKGSEIICRGGLSAGVNIGTASGIIDNLEENLSGFVWISTSDGTNVYMFNVSSADVVTQVPNIALAQTYGVGQYTVDGNIYFSSADTVTTDVLYKASISQLFDGVAPAEAFRFTPSGSPNNDVVISILTFNSNLYLGVNDDGASAFSRIYYWNGSTTTLEDTTPVQGYAPLLAITHTGELFTGYIRTGGDFTPPTTMRRRNSGTWSNVAMPGGVANFACLSSAVYAGATYFSGYTTNTMKGIILKWDGATLTKVVGPFANETVVEALAVFNGNLYYLWGDNASATLGQFNGATWTDSYRTFPGTALIGNDFAMASGNFAGGTLIPNDDTAATDLYAVIPTVGPTGSDVNVYKSHGTDVASAFTLVGTTTAPSPGVSPVKLGVGSKIWFRAF